MSIGYFTDKEHRPTKKEISTVLGRTSPLWDDILRFISVSYGLDGEFIFYARKYGWCRRYRKSGKALTTLFPAKDHFVAQVVLNPAQTEKAFEAALSEETIGVIKEAKPLHDGRWLQIKVKNKNTLKDVKELLLIKRKPVKR